MKHLVTLSIIVTSASAAFAGSGAVDMSKTPAPPPPPPVYGTGWYGAIQAGVNVYQDYGDGGDRTIDGFRFSFDADSKVGGFGGLKLGYVFGTNKVRPAIELDAYYNGFESDVDIALAGVGHADADGEVHSGAGLVNFLVRFDFGRCQPYVGAGAGVYYASLNDVDVTVNGQTFATDAGGDHTDFAWQLVGGVDYYFNEKMSAFLEYKFLNYEGLDADFVDEALRQHLVGIGLRIHF